MIRAPRLLRDAGRPSRGSPIIRMIQAICQPAWLVVATVLLSAAIWCIPLPGGGTLHHFTPAAALVIVAWYGTIVGAAALGFEVGSRLPSLGEQVQLRVNPIHCYLFLTVTGCVGVLFVVGAITARGGPSMLLESIGSHQVNKLKQTLYENYSAGIFTLRYGTILSGAVAIYRLLLSRLDPVFGNLRQLWMADVANLAALVTTSLISSRLSIACCGLIVLFLTVNRRTIQHVPLARMAVAALMAGGLLVFANHVRNGGFYAVTYGTSNPLMSQAIELERYLGEPFRVSLFTAQFWVDGQPIPDESDQWSDFVIPTFLRQRLVPRSSTSTGEWYRDLADVEDGLSTNSAFADLVPVFGVSAFVFMAAVSAIGAAAIGWLPRHGPVFSLSAAALLYAFAELWRLYLFSAGILSFLVLWPLVAAGFSRVIDTGRRRRRVARHPADRRSREAVAGHMPSAAG